MPKGINRRAFERVYWPYIPIVIAISLLLGLGASSGNLQAYVRHPAGRVLSYATSMSVGGLLADTNAARVANGVGALTLNSRLDAAAQAKANDMAARNYWSHYTPEGNPPWVFVTAQGYSYQKLGENLAAGFSDEQSTINGWMASPPHRENLLDPDFKDVGFGFANNPNYTSAGGGPMTIVVAFYGEPQVLAAQSSSPPAPAAPVSSTPAPAPQPAPASTPVQTAPATPAQQPIEQTKRPATSQTPKQNLTPSTKSTRVQLALSSSSIAPAASGVTVFGALLIAGFWASRHLRAIHKYLRRGERYAIRHPLTDVGLIIIAALLFIFSQTAGLIQ